MMLARPLVSAFCVAFFLTVVLPETCFALGYTATNGTPAGTPLSTPVTFKITGGLATSSYRIVINKIKSVGPGGIVFDPNFAPLTVATVPISTPGPLGTPVYTHSEGQTGMPTASGSYYYDFQAQTALGTWVSFGGVVGSP